MSDLFDGDRQLLTRLDERTGGISKGVDEIKKEISNLVHKDTFKSEILALKERINSVNSDLVSIRKFIWGIISAVAVQLIGLIFYILGK